MYATPYPTPSKLITRKPASWPRGIEYRDADCYQLSQRSVMDRRTAENGRVYTLTEHSAGYECAGSAMRWTDCCWAVTFELDGARHGRRYSDISAATSAFANLVS